MRLSLNPEDSSCCCGSFCCASAPTDCWLPEWKTLGSIAVVKVVTDSLHHPPKRIRQHKKRVLHHRESRISRQLGGIQNQWISGVKRHPESVNQWRIRQHRESVENQCKTRFSFFLLTCITETENKNASVKNIGSFHSKSGESLWINKLLRLWINVNQELQESVNF